MIRQTPRQRAWYRLYLARKFDPDGFVLRDADPDRAALHEAMLRLLARIHPESLAVLLEYEAERCWALAKARAPKRGRGAPKGPRKPSEREMIRETVLFDARQAGREGREPNLRAVARQLKAMGFPATEPTIYRRIHRELRVWQAEAETTKADQPALNMLAYLLNKDR